MLAGPRLTSTVLLSLAVSASAGVITRTTSPVTLALTKQFNLMGTSKILQIDQARAKVLMARAKGPAKAHAGPFNVPAINQAVYYSTTVGIGNPPKNFTLLIDTGSSNTWVGAQPNNAFVPSPSKSTGNVVKVVYGSGAFTGVEYMDTVHLGDVSIANQGFGGAVASQGFDSDIDGILGIGPVDLTCGTLFPDTSACIPTVTDNAFTEGLIGAHQVGISFAPSSSLNTTNGQITFGGIDYSRTNGPFTFVPITSTSPAKQFVGINQTISYGDADVLVLPNTAGITDTGTTLLLLATDAFKVYQNLTGAVMDKDTGLLRVTPQQFGNLRTLLFNIGGSPFELIPNAQAFPRALNGALGGSSDYVYLIVGDLGSNGGEGLGFINGMTFLERFYQVYDIANNRVGFATTQNTYALTN